MRVFIKLFSPALFLLMLFSNADYGQNNTVSKAFLLGRFDYRKDTSFTKVGHHYTDRAIYLKKETYRAYVRMYEDAAKDGVSLTMISGTRSFDDQCYKWKSKWDDAQFSSIKNAKTKASQLLRWWSMPGTSRHHWGTDVDLTNLKPAYYTTARGKKMYDWMSKNAAKYGFYQPFNANRTVGYQEEKWHWSYLPLSKVYLAEYKRQITYSDIFGFEGSNAAKDLDVINSQVLAVNPECK